MNRVVKKLILLAFLFFSSETNAKEYPMLHYTIEDGLPSNVIYDIYQDKDGFIWIGTDKGVARLNGQKFETFTTADGLADNECFFFQPDHYGRLWIGTFNGALCYYKDGKFHNAGNTPWLKLPFKASMTVSIRANPDSTLNIIFVAHPGFIEIDNEQIKHFTPSIMLIKFNDNPCVNIQKRADNQYDLFFPGKVVTIDQTAAVVKTKFFDSFRLLRLVNGDQGGVLMTDRYTYFSEQLKMIHIDKVSNDKSILAHRFEQSEQGNIVATNKGVFLNGNNHLFPELVIHDALRDREGDYWIGTATNGIFKLDKNFGHTANLPDTYNKPVVYAQTTPQYLFFADKSRNTFRIKKDSVRAESFFKFTSSNGIDNGLDCVHWIKDGIYYNFSHKNCFRISNINSEHINIKTIKTDKHLGSLNSVYFTDSFVYLKHRLFFDIANPKDLAINDSLVYKQLCLKNRNEAIYGSDVDHKKQLWSSGIDAVYKITGYNRIVQPQFGKTSFRQLVFFQNYLVGVSHQNELLVCRDYESNKVAVDTLRSGDCVWDKFYKLNDTALLISTNNYFRVLTIEDKGDTPKYLIRLLEKNQIPYQPEFLYNDSTNCYFFKNGAISIFPISDILEKDQLPVVKMLSLKTSDSNYILKDKIALDYFEGLNLNILFTAISFNHKNLSYEYAVSNKEKTDNWIAISGEELNLYKIGFGKFLIKVRAKTMSGEYSEPAVFELNISKPYWATYWFIAGCLVLGIALIAFAARIGIKQTLNKKEKEVRFLRSEYKALNALMNPHFIFNSLNSVQSLVNNNENKTASKYIRIFSDLIRQNMRNINQELISLNREMELVENYLRIEQLRFKEGLSYSIKIDEMVETELIMIPPLLIQPLVENAIKHGIWPKKSKNGFVQITIHEKQDFLFIEIRDNGIGLNKEKKSDTLHQSYAMSNIYKRIEQLSLIHQTNITVEINEIVGANNVVEGVRSIVKIDIANASKIK